MRTKSLAILALTGIVVLLLAACGSADSTVSDPLEGTSWVLMAYRKSRPIPGTTMTATFEEGTIRGSAGCNTYSATYQVVDDTIQVGPIAMTEMACLEPEGVMEQETMLLGLLQDAQTFRFVDEQLQILRSDGEALTFLPQE